MAASSSSPGGPQQRALADAELLDAWRSGDRVAGETLLVRHFGTLGRFFRNKVAPERVADLVQETFGAVVESRERIIDPARFRAYLLGVAYNLYCKHLRENYRRGSELDLDAVSIDALGETPSAWVVAQQEQRLLLEGLRAISINYQVVLELHYWEDLSTSQMAEVLGIPNGTVRSRLQRARDALEAAMARLARAPELLESTLTRLDDWAEGCRDQAIGETT